MPVNLKRRYILVVRKTKITTNINKTTSVAGKGIFSLCLPMKRLLKGYYLIVSEIGENLSID